MYSDSSDGFGVLSGVDLMEEKENGCGWDNK